MRSCACCRGKKKKGKCSTVHTFNANLQSFSLKLTHNLPQWKLPLKNTLKTIQEGVVFKEEWLLVNAFIYVKIRRESFRQGVLTEERDALSSGASLKHGPCLLTLKKKIQNFKTKCRRKLLRISYLEQRSKRINSFVGPQKPLLATVKRRKLKWFRHVTRHDGLSKTIIQGNLEGGRHRGQQRKCWMDNIKAWISLPMQDLLTRAPLQKRLKDDLC